MYEVWGAGNSYVELKRSVRQHSRARMAPWLGPAVRFKWVVDMFGNKMGLQAAVRVMNDLTSVVPFEVRAPLATPPAACACTLCQMGGHHQSPRETTEICVIARARVQGPVDLQNPDVKVWLMVVDTSGGVGLPRMPFRLVLAREIAHGDTARARMQPYKLTERRCGDLCRQRRGAAQALAWQKDLKGAGRRTSAERGMLKAAALWVWARRRQGNARAPPVRPQSSRKRGKFQSGTTHMTGTRADTSAQRAWTTSWRL